MSGIKILSRTEAEKKQDWNQSTLIAIRTPGDPPIEYAPGVWVLAEIFCHDTSEENFEKMKSAGVILQPFTADHARLCALSYFFSGQLGADLYIHCDMGQSRSAGVAAGLLLGLLEFATKNGESQEWIEDMTKELNQIYTTRHPNSWIKRLVQTETLWLLEKGKNTV